jgi:hypothetical protein
VAFHKTARHDQISRALDNPATSRSSERTNFFYFQSKQQKQHGVEVAMTVIISNNDGLARLREEARRRRTLRYKGPARPYRTDARPTYEAPTAATRTIVGDWFTDELGNLTRIIAGA